MGQAKRNNGALPTVAVCIPSTPPRAELLDRALGSVLEQTRPADQLIVKMDATGEGAGPTRNKAWQEATTDYVAFLDDDDEFLPNHLEVCMRTIRRANADLVYSWFELVGWPEATPQRPDAMATTHDGRLVHPLGVPFGPEQEAHMRRYAFIPITTVVRRAALERSGGFPTPGTPEWPRDDCEDWGGWLRLLDTGARFVHAPVRTWRCHYTVGDESPLTSTAGRPWK
jgi:hypothetical protein